MESARRRALMPDHRGDTRSRQGLWVDNPAPGGGGQRVVGLQIRSACRHLAAYAESAMRWVIYPRRLDARAGPCSRRDPAPGCASVAGLQPLWAQRPDRMARHCGCHWRLFRAPGGARDLSLCHGRALGADRGRAVDVQAWFGAYPAAIPDRDLPPSFPCSRPIGWAIGSRWRSRSRSFWRRSCRGSAACSRSSAAWNPVRACSCWRGSRRCGPHCSSPRASSRTRRCSPARALMRATPTGGNMSGRRRR